MPDACETALKNANSMSEIRRQSERMPEIQQEWMKSVELSKSVIERPFSRLMYSGQQVRTLDEVPATAIKEALLSLWPDLDLNKLTGKDLAANKDLEMFFKTHCRVRN
jgi:hypothetical protein